KLPLKRGQGWVALGSCRLLHFRSQLLPQHIDGNFLAFHVEVPEGPAVAGCGSLEGRADLVDGAAVVSVGSACYQGAVSAYPGRIAASRAVEQGAGFQQASFDQPAEGDARCFALRLDFDETGIRKRLNLGDSLFCQAGIVLFPLDPDPAAAQAFGDSARRAAAEEGI